MSQLTFFAEEPPANPSASQDSEKDWMTRVATSCLPLVPLLQSIAPSGWFGRTSPASCHQTEDGILEPSLGCWGNSGMGSPTGFSTLFTSEHQSTGAESLLSDVLEVGIQPQRFYLSDRQLKTCEKRLPGFRASTLPGWQRNRLCPTKVVAGLSMTDMDTDS